jgi:hypothetical protein
LHFIQLRRKLFVSTSISPHKLLDKVVVCLSLCLEALHFVVHVRGSNAPLLIMVINEDEKQTRSSRHLLLVTYLLTPRSRVLPEKLTGSQLVKKISAYYGTRNFNTAFHKFPSPVPNLSQINPVHSVTSNFLKFHLNIMLPSTPGSSKWSLSLRFPHQNHIYTSPLPHTCYTPRPSHSSRFDCPNYIW